MESFLQGHRLTEGERMILVSSAHHFKVHCDANEMCSAQLAQTLLALQYLHTLKPPVAHGDIKAVRTSVRV